MLYKQKKRQTKPVIMLSTFVGVYDDAHRKDDSKSVPAITDSYNKHMGTKEVIFNLLMRLAMNSYILYKLNTQKALNRQDYVIGITESLASEDKTVNKQVMESKYYQGKKRKIVVFALTVKKQKLGVNIRERFVLNATKAYMVLAWASINVSKYVIFCYLEIFLPY